MEQTNSNIQTIKGVKHFLSILPNVSHGSNAIQNALIESYGKGQVAYNQLVEEFNNLDLAEALEYENLEKEIKKKKKEIKTLEAKHINLSNIIGEHWDESNASTITSQILQSISEEIQKLIQKRDALEQEIREQEEKNAQLHEDYEINKNEFIAKRKKTHENIANEYKKKEEEIITAYNQKQLDIEENLIIKVKDSEFKIKEAENKASTRVKLINQFSDFLAETNKNMSLYKNTIYAVLFITFFVALFSIPRLLDTFNSFDNFINKEGDSLGNWQIINLALGLLIVKLPWALCISALLTGIYKLVKGILKTYEKINQDKRNMSAIYAVSGNIAQSLNQYGIEIAEEIIVNEDEKEIILKVKPSELTQKKENFKWYQIIKYFDKLDTYKEEAAIKEEVQDSQFLEKIVLKVLDKLPKS